MLTMIATLFLQVAATAAPPPDLIEASDVLAYCRTLLAKSASDKFNEHAAFIVRTPEARHYFVPLPSSGRDDLLLWRGRIPKGTVAIVHTHRDMRGAASKLDVMTARRLGIPVYILTARRIVKTDGQVTTVVRKGKW
jgi:proteasome lid subunit RPN8/RPN11